MNKTPLCYAPFINIFVSSKNRYAFCCSAKRISAKDPQDFWTNSKMIETRTKLLNGQFPEECIECETAYKLGLKSERDSWIKFNKGLAAAKTKRDYWKTFDIEINIYTGNSTNNPTHLDFRPSNKCNLKCRMCGPQASNLIEKEIKENPELNQWMSISPDEADLDILYDYFKKVSVKHVKILGGEPAIEPKVNEFLIFLLKSNQNPSIHVTTNVTTLNKTFYDVLKKFESVHFSLSIDGTDKTYEYIRTNSNWSKVKDNVENLITSNIGLSYIINTVLTPYNVFNLTSLIKWYLQLKKLSSNIDISFLSSANNENDNRVHDLSCVLPEDIDYVLEKLYSFYQLSNKNINIFNLIKVLETTEFVYTNHIKFIQYNNCLDKIRKTNLLDLDSKFVKYI